MGQARQFAPQAGPIHIHITPYHQYLLTLLFPLLIPSQSFIMMFNALYSFAILSIYCHASLAMPLVQRATPTIKVLASPAPSGGTTPARGKDNLCTAAQITAIKAAFAETRVLTQAAVTKLTVTSTENSEGVKTWVGTCM